MSLKDQQFLHRTTKNIISGTLGGISICLVGHPFDTLKVRLQTQPVHNPVYKGLADCFFKTLKWEGIGGLYKGVGKVLLIVYNPLTNIMYITCMYIHNNYVY